MTNTEHITTIQPIGLEHEQKVRNITGDYIRRAGRIFNHQFPLIPVAFDLKGRAAGMYKVHNRNRIIRYNPYIFARYFADNISTTVPHEVAHYVVDVLFDARRVKPHGVEWQEVMLSLGAEPEVTGDYDLTGIPVRRQRRFAYQCRCTVHHISSVRHNKILRGNASYYCRHCRQPLILTEPEK